MSRETNCTQFTEPYPKLGTDGADSHAVPVILMAIVEAYRPFNHGVLLFILLFAFFTNILIVIVLWQKEMRRVGVNVTMMLIAFCDFGGSVAALGHMMLKSYSCDYSTSLSAYTKMLCDYLKLAFHASSNYLAAGMAFCRIMSLNLSNKNRAPTFWETWKS
uniref:G_PROTEIN_RECEP_F1_2 domain-containing protein n=1 Tax=Caenorhabditis japonica TaxID=281687 RepID=A0A8R1I2R3_CAEJA